MSIRSSHKRLSNILDSFLNISGLGFYFQPPDRILYLPDSPPDYSNHCYNCIEPLYNIHNMLSTYRSILIMVALFLVAVDLSGTVATQPGLKQKNAEVLLSQGKHATASSLDDTSEQYAPPNNANDGDISSYWHSSTTTALPHWWQVDLEARTTISRVDIAWYNYGDIAFSYEIAVSDDNTTFKTIFNGATPFPPAYTYDPIDTSAVLESSTSARYLRVTITNSVGYDYGNWDYVGTHEIRVYGSAAAPPAPPPPTISYYIVEGTPTQAYNAGCALGRRDRDLAGAQNGIVILDFGRPAVLQTTAGSVYGTTLFDESFAAPARIIEATTKVGEGYWVCSGNDLSSKVTIAIGTNNKPLSGGNMAAHGAAWARIVNDTQTFLAHSPYKQQVRAVGASDMELGYNTPAQTRAWVDGYDTVNNWPLYNFGDAQGCPTSGNGTVNQACQSTISGWTQNDVWHISWNGPVQPIPQMYATSGVNARQWYQIALFSLVSHQQPMYFGGVLTQHGACADKTRELGAKPSVCVDADQTAEEGWTKLWTVLNDDPRTAQEIEWATDIRWDISKGYD